MYSSYDSFHFPLYILKHKASAPYDSGKNQSVVFSPSNQNGIVILYPYALVNQVDPLLDDTSKLSKFNINLLYIYQKREWLVCLLGDTLFWEVNTSEEDQFQLFPSVVLIFPICYPLYNRNPTLKLRVHYIWQPIKTARKCNQTVLPLGIISLKLLKLLLPRAFNTFLAKPITLPNFSFMEAF